MKINNDLRSTRKQIDGNRWYTINGIDHASVTTVLRFVDKGGAFNNWLKNNDAAEIELKMKNGARRGTRLHAWIEQYVNKCLRDNNGLPIIYDTCFIHPEYREHCKLWIDWCLENRVVFHKSEFVVHDENIRVAGTLDLVAEVNGRMAILDYKRRNRLGFYWTDGIQLTLLKYLWQTMWTGQVGAHTAEIQDLLLLCFYKTAGGEYKLKVSMFDYQQEAALNIAKLWWAKQDKNYKDYNPGPKEDF